MSRREIAHESDFRGWGLLGLRNAHFLRVHTVDDLIGMPGTDTGFSPISGRADLHSSLSRMPGNLSSPSIPHQGHVDAATPDPSTLNDLVFGILGSDDQHTENNNEDSDGGEAASEQSDEESDEDEDADEDEDGLVDVYELGGVYDYESDDDMDEDSYEDNDEDEDEDDEDDEDNEWSDDAVEGGVALAVDVAVNEPATTTLANNGGDLVASLDENNENDMSESSDSESEGLELGNLGQFPNSQLPYVPNGPTTWQSAANPQGLVPAPMFSSETPFPNDGNHYPPILLGQPLTSSPGGPAGSWDGQGVTAGQNQFPFSLSWVLSLPPEFQGAFGELGTALGELETAFQHIFQPPKSDAPHSKGAHRQGRKHRWGTIGDPTYKPGLPVNWIYHPHIRLAQEEPMSILERRMFVMRTGRQFINGIPSRGESAEQGLAPDYVLLRSYEKDFEMVPLATKKVDGHEEIRVVCTDALKSDFPRVMGVQRLFWATSRLSMLAHIPELFLVILGSPTGRVILVTPTRMAKPMKMESEKYQWDHGMRIECVLPRRSDDMVHRAGTSARPLYGLAVGPMLESEKNAKKPDASRPRRYRLMLHYQNHMILTYELTRDEQTQKLCVF